MMVITLLRRADPTSTRQGDLGMPMIDVYATPGTFSDRHALAQDLATAVMRWEQVPDLALFRNNTAAFVHELPADSIANLNGESNYVRVRVLTPVGVLDREKQLGVVKELTESELVFCATARCAEGSWPLRRLRRPASAARNVLRASGRAR